MFLLSRKVLKKLYCFFSSMLFFKVIFFRMNDLMDEYSFECVYVCETISLKLFDLVFGIKKIILLKYTVESLLKSLYQTADNRFSFDFVFERKKTKVILLGYSDHYFCCSFWFTFYFWLYQLDTHFHFLQWTSFIFIKTVSSSKELLC